MNKYLNTRLSSPSNVSVDLSSKGWPVFINVPVSFVVTLISSSVTLIRTLLLNCNGYQNISLCPFLLKIIPFLFWMLSILYIIIQIIIWSIMRKSSFFAIPTTKNHSTYTIFSALRITKFDQHVFFDLACINFKIFIILNFIKRNLLRRNHMRNHAVI